MQAFVEAKCDFCAFFLLKSGIQSAPVVPKWCAVALGHGIRQQEIADFQKLLYLCRGEDCAYIDIAL
jgi:hypothetical protein